MTIFQFALIRSLRKRSMLAELCAVPLEMIFLRPLWHFWAESLSPFPYCQIY